MLENRLMLVFEPRLVISVRALRTDTFSPGANWKLYQRDAPLPPDAGARS
jgi:hypothetical protein